MKLKKAIIIIISILILIALIPHSVLAATPVELPARVNNTYDWADGMYSMEAEKNTWVTIKGVKNTIDKYKEESYDNVAIEPSVGYGYYVAKTLGLNNSDMQSVISTSDSWENITNVKVKDSAQEINGTGPLYKRAKQYGTVYYGILEDSIKNNKRVFRIKDEDDVKSNVKVLVDQEAGTYTVGPYKIELNVQSNEYTNDGAKILYNELNRDGNEGYTPENTFAKTNNIGGMNVKEGTNPIFVDEKGQQISFPDFIPGQEKNFYIRFIPANDGAIVETGNPIINTSYLTKFVANKFIKGVPSAVKFGDVNIPSLNKLASTNIEGSIEQNNDRTEIVEQKVSTLKKRKYSEPAILKLDDETFQSIKQQFGTTSNIDTSAMKKVGDEYSIYIKGSPEGAAAGLRALTNGHKKDIITFDKEGNKTWVFPKDAQSVIITKNSERSIFEFDSNSSSKIRFGGNFNFNHHNDMMALAYADDLLPVTDNENIREAISTVKNRNRTSILPVEIAKEASNKLGSVSIVIEEDAMQIYTPENLTLAQKKAIDDLLSDKTKDARISIAVFDNKPDDLNHINRNFYKSR